ncbi:glycosyltransferase [Pontibacter sp. BAB1700]|uniref:glycosyltransferase n=1 Tax=Pontibacter sp. BAB1700 TaxID=1144253 RepID=UPI00026BD67A|nr:glycosyltransferase [Pontibacter sp. BAB1700]EJF08472.1 group 1 glycosyl transferase [Pontibacter sp. BAB1700]
MKILQIIQRPQLRGAEVFTCQLSTHLIDQGIEVVIVFLFAGKGKIPFNGKIINANANERNKLFDYSGWKKLSQIIKEEAPSIVQANAADTLKYAVLSKLIFKWDQPVIFRNASIVSLYLRSVLQKSYNSFLYKHVSKVISVSEQSRQDIIKLFPHLVDKSLTIPIGVEEVATSEINPFIGFENKTNIVHVGGFTFEKNHKGLLRIFSKAAKDNPNLHLWMIGDGPLKKEIEEIVSEMQIRDQVHLVGFVGNAQDYISFAECLVLPSIIEGLPAVIIEAMALRTPVVAYNVGGIKEILSNDKTGWLIEKDDEESFSVMINEALKSNPARKQIIDRAFEEVQLNYLNSKIAAKFQSVYKSYVS